MAEEVKPTETVEEQTEKKSFKEWYSEHPKTVFGIRLALWSFFSAILPFLFIAFRYGIFSSDSKIKLSGWGIIGIIVLLVFGITLVRYLTIGMKQCLAKQCLVGFFKVILPLLILLLLVVEVRNHMKLVAQALGCVIVCELVGIPLNPFPDWLEQKRVKEGRDQAQTLSEIFWDTFFKKKKDHE